MTGVFPPLEVLRRRRRNTELYCTKLDGRDDCLVFVVLSPMMPGVCKCTSFNNRIELQ